MEVSVEDLSSVRKSLKIVLPPKKVTSRVAAAYKKLNLQVSLKGFRKGKVPQKVLEKNYADQVKNEVSEKLIKETYFEALEQTKLDAVVHPDIKTFSFEEDGTFCYEAEVDVKPDFELQQYKGIEIEHPEITVSDEEIGKSLVLAQKEMAALRSVDGRGAMENDLVIIDFQGYDDKGVAMPNVKGTEYSVDIGSGSYGKEFEDMLLGLKKGEKTSREINFSAAMPNPILAGHKVKFELSVKDVKERVMADLDDDFAKDVNDSFETLDDLRSSISEKIRKQKEMTSEGDLTDKIMLKVIESHNFDLPARLVAFEINELVKQMEGNLSKQGLTLESAGLNQEKLAEQYKDAAERRVKGEFILKKIAEIEDIKLSDENINKGLSRISQQYNMSVDEIKKYFEGRNQMLPFMNELLNEKLLQFLKSEAKIVYVAADQINTAEDSQDVGEE